MRTVSRNLRPVVALDIDGVLRLPISPGQHIPDAAFSAEVTFRREDYPTDFHGAPYWDDNGESRDNEWFSGIGRDFVLSLLDEDRVDVVLATTWQHWANMYFSDILGFPELPVAVRSITGEYHHCSPAWKSHQLSRQFDGRPLMWVDDNRWDRPSESLFRRRRPLDRALTHFQRPNPYTGIIQRDVTEMTGWLSLAQSPEGHTQLRDARRRQNKREASTARRNRLQLDRHHAWTSLAVAALEPYVTYERRSWVARLFDIGVGLDDLRNALAEQDEDPTQAKDIQDVLSVITRADVDRRVAEWAANSGLDF